CGLAHQAPRKVVAPHAAHAQSGEAAVNVHLFSGSFRDGNFCRPRGILPSDELIVSRFSSLSGCLNPKLRRFAPGLYPLYRGLFISATCSSHDSSRSRHSSTPCRVTLENSITLAPSVPRTCFKVAACSARESLSAFDSSTRLRTSPSQCSSCVSSGVSG